MSYEAGCVQLDEADFSEAIEVEYKRDDKDNLVIVSATGHFTYADYTEAIVSHQRYLDIVENLIVNSEVEAYERHAERYIDSFY